MNKQNRSPASLDELKMLSMSMLDVDVGSVRYPGIFISFSIPVHFLMQFSICMVDSVRRTSIRACCLVGPGWVGYFTHRKMNLTSVMVGTGSDPGCGVLDPVSRDEVMVVAKTNRLSAPVSSPVRHSPTATTKNAKLFLLPPPSGRPCPLLSPVLCTHRQWLRQL